MSNVSSGRVFKSFQVFKEMKFWDFGVPDPSLAHINYNFIEIIIISDLKILIVLFNIPRTGI